MVMGYGPTEPLVQGAGQWDGKLSSPWILSSAKR